MLKKTVALLLSILLLIGLIGCSAGTQELKQTEQSEQTAKPAQEAPAEDALAGTIVTMMISQANYQDEYQQIMDKIKEDTGIKVDLQVLPDDQYFDAVNVKLSTGEVPDIMMNTIPQRYAAVNAAENCVVLNDQPWVSRMVNAGTVKDEEGNIYGMPLASSGSAMGVAYNKEILRQAGYENPNPQTWDEFVDILEAVKQKCPGVTPIFMSDADTWTTQVFIDTGLSVALGEKGTEVYKKVVNNEIKMADIPEYKQILEDFKSLYDNGYVNADHLSATYDMGNEAVATGKAAIYNIPDFGVIVMATLTDPDNIGIFTIPYGDRIGMASSIGLTGFMIPKEAKNMEAALKVLDLMSQPDYLNIYYAAHPGNPAFEDVDCGDVLPCIKETIQKYVGGDLTYVEMNGQLAAFSPVHTEWWNYYVELTMGAKTVDEVIAAVDTKNADYMRSLGQEGW